MKEQEHPVWKHTVVKQTSELNRVEVSHRVLLNILRQAGLEIPIPRCLPGDEHTWKTGMGSVHVAYCEGTLLVRWEIKRDETSEEHLR